MIVVYHIPEATDTVTTSVASYGDWVNLIASLATQYTDKDFTLLYKETTYQWLVAAEGRAYINIERLDTMRQL